MKIYLVQIMSHLPLLFRFCMNDIEFIKNKIKLLEQKKKTIYKSLHTQDKKVRTRFLIQTGCLCEKYFDMEGLTLRNGKNF